MKSLTTIVDKRELGWWPAVMLALSFSIQAGALDFDKEMRRQNYMTVEAVDGMAKARSPNKNPKKALPSLEEADLEPDYKVELIPAKRGRS